jgi:hypothetical protein
MDLARRSLRWGLWAAASALLAAPGVGQSYGDREQVLTIGAAAFQSAVLLSNPVYYGPDLYLYHDHNDAGIDLSMRTPLSLPEGAEITRLCVAVRDTNPDPHLLYASLHAVKLVPGGEAPASSQFAIVDSDVSSGYGVSCGNLSYTVRSRVDVDHDGTLDAVLNVVGVYIGNPPQDVSAAFSAVQIFWKRQVRPGPDMPTFADVPKTDPAYDDIEALAASAITAGCAGGNYCPGATLTRKQMAVFLAKALGLHWTN